MFTLVAEALVPGHEHKMRVLHDPVRDLMVGKQYIRRSNNLFLV